MLITGIGKGIGRALANKFLVEKHRVVGTYYREKPDRDSGLLSFVPLDLSSGESIDKAIGEISLKNIKFDIFINNAGVLLDENDTAVDVNKLRQTLEVNLIGTIDFTEQVLPILDDRAHVINISSTAGSFEYTSKGVSHFPDHYPAYKISKAGINMYTVTLARRLTSSGVIVSAVHPGWVRTDIGGDDAEITPEEAAKDIYDFALTRPESGLFWHKGKPLPW